MRSGALSRDLQSGSVEEHWARGLLAETVGVPESVPPEPARRGEDIPGRDPSGFFGVSQPQPPEQLRCCGLGVREDGGAAPGR